MHTKFMVILLLCARVRGAKNHKHFHKFDDKPNIRSVFTVDKDNSRSLGLESKNVKSLMYMTKYLSEMRVPRKNTLIFQNNKADKKTNVKRIHGSHYGIQEDNKNIISYGSSSLSAPFLLEYQTNNGSLDYFDKPLSRKIEKSYTYPLKPKVGYSDVNMTKIYKNESKTLQHARTNTSAVPYTVPDWNSVIRPDYVDTSTWHAVRESKLKTEDSNEHLNNDDLDTDYIFAKGQINGKEFNILYKSKSASTKNLVKNTNSPNVIKNKTGPIEIAQGRRCIKEIAVKNESVFDNNGFLEPNSNNTPKHIDEILIQNLFSKNMDEKLVDTDIVLDGSLNKAIAIDSIDDHLDDQEMQQEANSTKDENEAGDTTVQDQFKDVLRSMGKDPNAFLDEFTNVIFSYVRNKLPRIEAIRTLERLINKINLNKKQRNTTETTTLAPEIKKPKKVVLNDTLRDLKEMLLGGDIAVVNYDWFNSGINIQVRIKKILKLCASTELTHLDWKLFSFMRNLFETLSEFVPKEIRSRQLDEACTFFQSVLDRLKPLHVAMDEIQYLDPTTDGMFWSLKKDFLVPATEDKLLIVLLHFTANRILEQILLKFQDAPPLNNMKHVISGIRTEEEANNFLAYLRKKNKIAIADFYADLLEDLALAYAVMHELNKYDVN